MSFPDSRIATNRGSDIDADIQFTDEDGNPFNLFGWTVSTYDVSPALTTPTNLVTVTTTDELDGRVHVRIEWDERLEVGVGYQVRLRLQDDPEDQATNIIGVLYQ
jgi:hypothetical protein